MIPSSLACLHSRDSQARRLPVLKTFSSRFCDTVLLKQAQRMIGEPETGQPPDTPLSMRYSWTCVPINYPFPFLHICSATCRCQARSDANATSFFSLSSEVLANPHLHGLPSLPTSICPESKPNCHSLLLRGTERHNHCSHDIHPSTSTNRRRVSRSSYLPSSFLSEEETREDAPQALSSCPLIMRSQSVAPLGLPPDQQRP